MGKFRSDWKENLVWYLSETDNHTEVKYHHRERFCFTIITFHKLLVIVGGSDDSPCSVFTRWETSVRIFGWWITSRRVWKALIGGYEKGKEIELLPLTNVSKFPEMKYSLQHLVDKCWKAQYVDCWCCWAAQHLGPRPGAWQVDGWFCHICRSLRIFCIAVLLLAGTLSAKLKNLFDYHQVFGY